MGGGCAGCSEVLGQLPRQGQRGWLHQHVVDVPQRRGPFQSQQAVTWSHTKLCSVTTLGGDFGESGGGNFPSILWILKIIMAFTFFFVLSSSLSLYVLNVLFKYNTYPEKRVSVILDEFSQVEHTMLGAPRPRNRT